MTAAQPRRDPRLRGRGKSALAAGHFRRDGRQAPARNHAQDLRDDVRAAVRAVLSGQWSAASQAATAASWAAAAERTAAGLPLRRPIGEAIAAWSKRLAGHVPGVVAACRQAGIEDPAAQIAAIRISARVPPNRLAAAIALAADLAMDSGRPGAAAKSLLKLTSRRAAVEILRRAIAAVRGNAVHGNFAAAANAARRAATAAEVAAHPAAAKALRRSAADLDDVAAGILPRPGIDPAWWIDATLPGGAGREWAPWTRRRQPRKETRS